MPNIISLIIFGISYNVIEITIESYCLKTPNEIKEPSSSEIKEPSPEVQKGLLISVHKSYKYSFILKLFCIYFIFLLLFLIIKMTLFLLKQTFA